jgi:small-conductance mechanosensitive channel
MARRLIIFSKYIVLAGLSFINTKEEEWSYILKPWGKVITNGHKFSPLVSSMLHFVIFALGLNLLIILLSSVYRRRQGLPKGKMDNVLSGLQNIYVLLMSAAIITALLSLLGIEVKSLFTGLTIVAAALAIITKDYVVNIISGIAISFSDEISIDDYIKIGDHRGKVTEISIARISLLNDDDDIIFIPNNTVYTAEIINYTKKGLRKVNIEFELDTTFKDTIEELEKDLTDSLSDYRDHIEDGSFRLKVVDIFKDHLKLKFQFSLKQINRELEREIRRKTVRRVVNHIRNNPAE